MSAFQVQAEDPPPDDPQLQAASNRVSMSATQLGARPISALNTTSKTLNPFLNEFEGLGASLRENGAADLEAMDASVHSTIIRVENDLR